MPPTIPKADPQVLSQMQACDKDGGLPVRYYPVHGRPEFQETSTRSKPWELAPGRWVVMVHGVSGCVAVSHCQLS